MLITGQINELSFISHIEYNYVVNWHFSNIHLNTEFNITTSRWATTTRQTSVFNNENWMHYEWRSNSVDTSGKSKVFWPMYCEGFVTRLLIILFLPMNLRIKSVFLSTERPITPHSCVSTTTTLQLPIPRHAFVSHRPTCQTVFTWVEMISASARPNVFLVSKSSNAYLTSRLRSGSILGSAGSGQRIWGPGQ